MDTGYEPFLSKVDKIIVLVHVINIVFQQKMIVLKVLKLKMNSYKKAFVTGTIIQRRRHLQTNQKLLRSS